MPNCRTNDVEFAVENRNMCAPVMQFQARSAKSTVRDVTSS
jgi:hypothetical protein